jgi:Na+/H+-translocating membrane pyrophosphatase
MFNIFFSDLLSIQNPLYIIGLIIVAAIGYFFVNIPLKAASKK